MNFAYYIFLLLIIFLCIFTLKENIEVSPKKIKIYLSIIITLLLLRHVGLFLLCILKSSNFIYYLKPIIYLNHLSIPLIVLAVTYVYSRIENLKFTGSYFVALTAFVIYGIIIYESKVVVQVSHLYGFIISIDKETWIFLFSLILLGIMIILNVLLLDKKYVNKKGIWFVISASTVVMMEDVIILGGIKVFPYSIIGDFIFLIIMNFVLRSFKRLRYN